MKPEKTRELLDPEFLKKLELLRITSKRVLRGQLKGEQRSSKKGSSVEFRDYRDYVHGDDLRYIDWNVYGRLERLFLKLFREEIDLTLHLMIDSSRSMSFGSPGKLEYAKQIAAALSYIALSNLDRVAVVPFARELGSYLPPVRGRPQVFKAFEFISRIQAVGETNINHCLRGYALGMKIPGVVVVISDFLDPGGYEEGLKYLRYRGSEVVAVQVVDEAEVNPKVMGDLKLVDMETGEHREISIGRSTLAAYARRYRAFCEALESFCGRHEIDFLRASTAVPFDRLLLEYLERRRLLAW